MDRVWCKCSDESQTRGTNKRDRVTAVLAVAENRVLREKSEMRFSKETATQKCVSVGKRVVRTERGSAVAENRIPPQFP